MDGDRRVFGYTRRTVALDLFVVAAVIPGLLIALHLLLPESARTALVLQHGDPDPLEFLTAAYVHSNVPHLRNNVTGYLAAIVMAYLLCLEAGRRRWFFVTFGAVLVLIPVFVNLVSYVTFAGAFPAAPSTRGFSAVVAATGGFVYVSLLVLLRTAYSTETATFAGTVVFLVLLVTFYLLHVSVIEPLLLAGASASALLCLAALAVSARGRLPRTRAGWLHLGTESVPVVLVTALLVAFVVGLFPQRVVVDGMVINVYAHWLGLVGGVAAAVLLEPIVAD
ncbi:hypothetical protein [Natranaeroarchaeum aerophilus]|uniref:Uncharacterized protein n=1 Tax=Natranaeroarchaeum aerophilus TaxID=2917711 RepID=A0AAE3FRL8_9EURY|nr:hypothetical protein [Natranaeroarchaeum aerophilus]MCL9813891.1 hypothetical protein [Natranaeroarchaeum aerophilus]